MAIFSPFRMAAILRRHDPPSPLKTLEIIKTCILSGTEPVFFQRYKYYSVLTKLPGELTLAKRYTFDLPLSELPPCIIVVPQVVMLVTQLDL